MTYINHLNNFYKIVEVEERFHAFHISLYMALFQIWNKNRFKSPICIYRDTVMGLSKIGSTHTYYKCLNELHGWGYLEYVPSKNGLYPSYVTLYSIDQNFIDQQCKNDISKNQAVHKNKSKNDTSNDFDVHGCSGKNDTSKNLAVLPYKEIVDNKDFIEGKEVENTTTSIINQIENNIDLENKSELIQVQSNSLKGKRKKVPQKKEKDLLLPFSSQIFIQQWSELLQMPKWKNKPEKSLVSVLKQLQEYDEEFVIAQIKTAIGSNWQGLIFPETKEKYDKWKQSKNLNDDEKTTRNSRIFKQNSVQNTEPERDYSIRL